METILFFVVTLLASVVGAISGIGGGIIIKPLLELLAGERVEIIAFVSGCTVLSMAAMSLIRRRGQMRDGFELRRGTLLAVGSALGGVLGKLLLDAIWRGQGSDGLGTIQSALLALMIAFLIALMTRQTRIRALDMRSSAACALLGAALGMLGAFLGIGGGPLNLVALTYFLSMDNKRASLHSIYIILFAQLASLVMAFLQGGAPDVPPMLLWASMLGGVLGALAGSALVARMSNRAIGRLYCAVLVFVMIIALINLAGHLGSR